MRSKNLLLIFAFALLIECLAIVFNLTAVQYVSKPSLMLILGCYFAANSRRLGRQKSLIIAALVFSWIGDVVLLAEKKFAWLFVIGLASFLIAHIFYVVYFWQIRKINSVGVKIKLFPVIAVLAYSLTFYFFLLPNVGTLKIPILFYTVIISLMLIASFQAFDLSTQSFGRICVAGALLFTLSDSILAYNRFVSPIPFGGAFVMLTYALGQLLIAEGALRNLNYINNRLT